MSDTFAMGDSFEAPVARAPWTPDQVASLNGFQAVGGFHPFTCGNDDCPGTVSDDGDAEHAALVAEEDGWHCPACDYTQDWAHAIMAGGAWRDWTGIEIRVNGGLGDEQDDRVAQAQADQIYRQIGATGSRSFLTERAGPIPIASLLGRPYTHVLTPPETEEEIAANPFLPSLTITREGE